MTDLSTKALTRLLDQAAPGPWEARGYYMDGEPRPDDSHQIRSADGEYLGIMHGPDAILTAAAPELAQEVLRMRTELTSLVADLTNIHDNPEHSHMECLFALFTAMRLHNIIGHHNLGDHDG